MKKNRTKIVGKSLYVTSAILLVYGFWSVISTSSQINTMISAGKLTFKGSEYDIVNFIVSNSINYFIFAIVLIFIGWYLVKSGANQEKEDVIEIVTESIIEPEVEVEKEIELPLSLLDGNIKTSFKEAFEYGDTNYAEVFFTSPEKIEIQEAYDTVDGNSGIILANVSDTWQTLSKAFKSVCAFYGCKIKESDLPYKNDKISISEKKSFGKEEGFYVCELGKEAEVYLFLNINKDIYLMRYTSDKSLDQVAKLIEKIKVTSKK